MMPFNSFYVGSDGELRAGLDEEDLRELMPLGSGLLWVDFYEPTEDDAHVMLDVLGFHPVSVEVCLDATSRGPKIEDFDDYVFLVTHGINHALESELVETAELDMFIGHNFVVSCHYYPLYSVDAVEQRIRGDRRIMRRGAAHLAHALLDALVENINPTIDRMRDVADAVEEESIRRPRQETLEHILRLKRSSLRIHRAIAPERDVLLRLFSGEFPVIRSEERFYTNLHDHVSRIAESNQIIRERADNALATYLSSMSIRQNEVMKVLAIVAVVFLPLTLIAGIYGMNFAYMPELGWRYGYFAVLALMVVVAAGALWLFWARRWITVGRVRELPRRPFAVAKDRLVGYSGQIHRVVARGRDADYRG